jgi:hypothetical protein
VLWLRWIPKPLLGITCCDTLLAKFLFGCDHILQVMFIVLHQHESSTSSVRFLPPAEPFNAKNALATFELRQARPYMCRLVRLPVISLAHSCE